MGTKENKTITETIKEKLQDDPKIRKLLADCDTEEEKADVLDALVEILADENFKKTVAAFFRYKKTGDEQTYKALKRILMGWELQAEGLEELGKN